MKEHCDVAVLLEQWGFATLRHPMHLWRRGARVATMVSGNASVQLHFEPRSGRGTPRTGSEIPRGLFHRLVGPPGARLAARPEDVDGLGGQRRSPLARIKQTP